LKIEGQFGNFGHLLLDQCLKLAISFISAEVVEASCHEDGFSAQSVPEVIIECNSISVVRTTFPETFHSLQRNSILDSRVDNINALEQLKQAIKARRFRLAIRGLWSLSLRGACTVLNPAFSEQLSGGFTNILISVSEAPSQQLLAHG
jgi:hypothetical protein